MRLYTRLVLVAFAFSIVQPALGQEAKKRVEAADQLPVHSYPVSGKASDLLNDDAFVKLISGLQRDLISDLRDYDIEDKTTLKNYYNALMQIAYLTSHYDEALSYLQEKSALEDKPAAKAMAGLVEQPLIDSAKAGTEQAGKVFESDFAERMRKLPYETVQNEVKAQKGRLEIYSPNFLAGMVEQHYDTLAQKTATIPKEAAMDIVNTRFMIREILPHKDFMVQELQVLIAAHHVKKKDIWAERTVTLSESDHLTPTVIAIWDAGVDPGVFPGKMWINTKEIPNNGKDDDGNGYVDDVYGIGWDWFGKKNVGPLRELHMSQAEIEPYKHYSKGVEDMRASLDTPEAAELRRKLSTLQKDEVRPFMEGNILYEMYAHGTHVGSTEHGRSALVSELGRQTRSSTLWFRFGYRDKWFDYIPQSVRQ